MSKHKPDFEEKFHIDATPEELADVVMQTEIDPEKDRPDDDIETEAL